MEEQYYNKYKPRLCFINKKTITHILLSTVLMIALSHICLICNAQGSFSGMQLFVHATRFSGKISVCVFSEKENLGCRIITSPDTVPFVFKTESLGDHQ